MLSQNRDELQLMHSKTDNIESMIDNKTNEINYFFICIK